MELKDGYKQTEVGVIPEDWEVTALSRLVDRLEAGVSVNSLDSDKGTYGHDEAVLKTSCVSGGKFDQTENKKIAPRDLNRAKCNPVKNTIFISRMNTPALVAECGYVGENYPNLFLPDRLWMTRHNTQRELCVRWLAFLLSSPKYNRTLKESASGTSGSMKNLSKPAFFSTLVPLPPTKAEQEAIAEILSDMDRDIDALESKLTKVREIKQGMMQELLTGKTRLI